MKERASRNRTLTCLPEEMDILSKKIKYLSASASLNELDGKVVQADFFEVARYLPTGFADVLILDPPYNLSKNYNGQHFKQKEAKDYANWFQEILELLKPTLKENATIYVCSDWKTSIIIGSILEQNFFLQNRITWEREKGRGAKSNWKNNIEDIWFCTRNENYVFNVDAVKLKKKVIAPYRENGTPKDWQEEHQGNFRLTHPSNIWTDITVPFWSMPENTDHPTQKPEKLIAKLLLASSDPGSFVFDPFLGSGTTAVVAQKLGRRWLGIEMVRDYCCWALKRLALAKQNPEIQGYSDGVFWERNTLSEQPKPKTSNQYQDDLFS